MGEGRLTQAAELKRRADTHLVSAGWLSAQELLEQALELYRDESDAAGETSCLRGLADVAAKLGETERAQELYKNALQAAERAGDRTLAADCLFHEADMLRATERHGEAAERFQDAATIYREAGHRKGEARCLGLLGELGRLSGDDAKAVLSFYREAQRIQMEVGDLQGAAITFTFTANYLTDTDPVAAAATFVQAARIYEGLGLHHRAEPFLAAARRLDPENAPAPQPRRPGPWDTEDD